MTPAQAVQHAIDLGVDEVCIRTPVYYKPYNASWHKDLANRLRADNIEVSLWPVVSLYNPEGQAAAIKAEVAEYIPTRIVLDAEGHWILDYIANLDRFLNALRKPGVPVGLGSYRRASLHQGMRWQTWLKHKTGSIYTIDFMAHQLYPIGWKGVANWVEQTRLDVESHEAELAKAGRSDMPWMPWLPSFIGGGFEGLSKPWVPSAEEMSAQVAFLRGKLGSRLLGVNFWSLDKSLVDMPDVYWYVKGLNSTPPAPPEQPPADAVEKLWNAAKAHGWEL